MFAISGKKESKQKVSVVIAPADESDEDESQTYFEIEELEEEDPPEDENTDTVFYFCGACDMNFDSLDDHVKKYHKNESKFVS